MEKKTKARLILFFASVIAVLLIANSLVFHFRADLTENKAYTLADESVNIARSLKEPLYINYYVSTILTEQIPQIQNLVDLLHEYSRSSNGMVRAKVIDPEKNETGVKAESLGLQAQQYQVVKENQMSTNLVYSGVQIQYLNRSQVIPLVTDPGNFEYELSSAIKNLSTNRKPILGILSGKTSSGEDATYNTIRQVLGQNIELRILNKGEIIPADIQVLFVFDDSGLSENDARNVDQFIMSGKGVLLGLDSWSVEVSNPYGNNPFMPLYTGGGQAVANIFKAKRNPEGAIKKILPTYGLELEPGIVFDMESAAIPVLQIMGQNSMRRDMAYPLWLRAGSRQLSQTSSVTKNLSNVDLYWASSVKLLQGFDGQVLIKTSSQSLNQLEQPSVDPLQSASFVQSQLASGGQNSYNLAIARLGELRSAFEPENRSTWIFSTAKGRLVLVGDADFGSDLIAYTQSESNITFIRNLYEYLAGDESIMKLRNRIVVDAKLDLIADKSHKDAVIFLAWLVNTVLIPLAVVVFGLVRLAMRRKKSKQVFGEKL